MARGSGELELRHELDELHACIEALQSKPDSSGTGMDESAIPQGPFLALGCRTGTNDMAIPLTVVERVVPMALLRALPESPPWMLGLLNFSGTSIPVLDAQGRFDRRARNPSVHDLLIICRTQGGLVALAVQEVLDILSGHTDDIQAIPKGMSHGIYLLGMLHQGEHSFLLLHIARLFALSHFAAPSP